MMTIAAPKPRLRPLPLGLLWQPGCHCPGCGRRQWHVGRVTAECAFCLTALIIPDARPERTLP